MLYMFQTVLVQEQLYKLYIAFGICRYHTSATQQPDVWYRLLCGYRHTKPDVSAYTMCDVQLIKVAPDDGLIQSETCRAYSENKV